MCRPVFLLSFFLFFFSSRKKMRTCTKKFIIRYFVWMLAQINVFVTFRIMQFDLRTFVFFSGLFLPLWIDYGTGLITASRGKTFPIPFKWTFKFFCPALHVDCVRKKGSFFFFFFFFAIGKIINSSIEFIILFFKKCLYPNDSKRKSRTKYSWRSGRNAIDDSRRIDNCTLLCYLCKWKC